MKNLEVQKAVTVAATQQAQRLKTALSQLVGEKAITQDQSDAVIVRLLQLMGQPVG